MKKKLLSLLVCLALALTLLPAPALAAFSDVRDPSTATAAEVLRLMGVLDGYGDGTFRPQVTLNRAQFCKMVIHAIGAEKELGRYSTVTIFPDVKPSHWASAYINLAAQGQKIIAGYADGRFHPELPVTLGHAATILLRLLGYKDENISGVWPDGYISTASSIGLLDGVGSNGQAPLTRAQAAALFVNLLQAKTADNAAFFTIGEETIFSSIDSKGRMVTTAGTYEMEYPKADSSLTGLRGKVVMRGTKALTFLPVGADGTPNVTGAVILPSSGAAGALSSLTGNATGYSIFKNGVSIAAWQLQKNDVATWSAATNSVQVCDTRLRVLYEDCYPDPDHPAVIQILGGTEFNVLPSAVESLKAFHPGQVIILLMTADGQVAGALKDDGVTKANCVAFADSKGALRLLCGGEEIPLKLTAGDYAGQLVSVTTEEKNVVRYFPLGSAVSGTLNVQDKTLGGVALAANARIFLEGETVTLDKLDRSIIPSNEILSVHTNWTGQIDIVAISSVSDVVYGRVMNVTRKDEKGSNMSEEEKAELERPERDPGVEITLATPGKTYYLVQIETGRGNKIEYKSNSSLPKGSFVSLKLNSAKDTIRSYKLLDSFKDVSSSSWIEKTAVTCGGRTYTVAENVSCFNRDTERWITLDEAFRYGGTMNVYVSENAVRIIDVGRG